MPKGRGSVGGAVLLRGRAKGRGSVGGAFLLGGSSRGSVVIDISLSSLSGTSMACCDRSGKEGSKIS